MTSSIARRPNPNQVWLLNVRLHAGHYPGALLVQPYMHCLALELKSTRPGENVYFDLEAVEEETLRRLLNERHKAKQVQQDLVVPELQKENGELRTKLREATAKLAQVLGPEEKPKA